MKRKIFASKDSSGFRSYLKFLLWAAIGLVVLVLFIPLTSRQKAGKEALKKPSSEKGGVVREIPKTLQPVAESLSRGQGEPSGTPPKTADSKPATAPDGKGAGPVTESAQQAASKEKPAEAPTALPQKAEPAPEATPKKTVGPPGSHESTGAGQVAKEAQPAPKSADAANKESPASPKKPAAAAPPITEPKPKALASAPAPARAAKPSAADTGPVGTPPAAAPDSRNTAPSDGRKMYTVQIAALKDKNSAEELKKTLHKKGFDAIVKVTGDPKQGQTYALQLQPVDDIGKASTLMEQVKYVPQAKPTIITVPAGR
jgi:cell division septation protein DedD